MMFCPKSRFRIVILYLLPGAYRTKVLKYFKRNFSSIDEAEDKYGINYFEDNSTHVKQASRVDQSDDPGTSSILDIVSVFKNLSKRQSSQLLDELFFLFLCQENDKFTRGWNRVWRGHTIFIPR